MVEAALWGLVAASSLVIAAEVAFAVRLSRMVVGLIMAFGVGALIASVSFELVEPALGAVPGWQAALALAAGSLVFFFGDRAIASMGGSERKRTDGDGEEEGSGLGIVLGTVLDGIPESAVLGMSLVGGGGVSTALLAGIWVSNFPRVARQQRQPHGLGMVALPRTAPVVGDRGGQCRVGGHRVRRRCQQRPPHRWSCQRLRRRGAADDDRRRDGA